MIELKVIEKFMEENGLEPYDAFDVDGEFKQCNPLYFNCLLYTSDAADE